MLFARLVRIRSKRLTRSWGLLTASRAGLCALVFVAGCSWLQSFYTSASPLPARPQMEADCTAKPGSGACDVLALLTKLCSGEIAIPLSVGNLNQLVCVGLQYGPGAPIAAPTPAPAK